MIRKTIIPAAGVGTRMLPAAKAIPKEMLPILDRPVIQYVVQESADAGATDLLFITSVGKEAIDNHFGPAPDLEHRLALSGKAGLLDSINALRNKVTISTVLQNEQRGLGHAVLQAKSFVGQDPCLCLLGDTIFSGSPSPSQQLIDSHARLGGTIIGLEEVPLEKVGRYGIIAGQPISDGLWRIDKLIEKPAKESTPSRLAIAARYILSPAIFELLERTQPGAGGEIQLTDALNELAQREPMHGVLLSAKRHDIGNPADWLITNVEFAMGDAKLRGRMRSVLNESQLTHRR